LKFEACASEMFKSTHLKFLVSGRKHIQQSAMLTSVGLVQTDYPCCGYNVLVFGLSSTPGSETTGAICFQGNSEGLLLCVDKSRDIYIHDTVCT